MKKLKGLDIPDLIKTVKAKKLPKEAIRSILPKFKLNGDKVELTESPEDLKEQASKVYSEYVTEVEANAAKLREVSEFVNNKIKSSGLYEDPPEPRVLYATVNFVIPEDRVHTTASAIQIQKLIGTTDLIGMKTYAQIV